MKVMLYAKVNNSKHYPKSNFVKEIGKYPTVFQVSLWSTHYAVLCMINDPLLFQKRDWMFLKNCCLQSQLYIQKRISRFPSMFSEFQGCGFRDLESSKAFLSSINYHTNSHMLFCFSPRHPCFVYSAEKIILILRFPWRIKTETA